MTLDELIAQGQALKGAGVAGDQQVMLWEEGDLFDGEPVSLTREPILGWPIITIGYADD